jgi:hypothetical protein
MNTTQCPAPPRLSLDQQFHIRGARGVIARAMFQRVIEPVETEIVSAARIGSV